MSCSASSKAVTRENVSHSLFEDLTDIEVCIFHWHILVLTNIQIFCFSVIFQFSVDYAKKRKTIAVVHFLSVFLHWLPVFLLETERPPIIILDRPVTTASHHWLARLANIWIAILHTLSENHTVFHPDPMYYEGHAQQQGKNTPLRQLHMNYWWNDFDTMEVSMNPINIRKTVAKKKIIMAISLLSTKSTTPV